MDTFASRYKLVRIPVQPTCVCIDNAGRHCQNQLCICKEHMPPCMHGIYLQYYEKQLQTKLKFKMDSLYRHL